MPDPLGWHGFSSHMAFLRATLSLGITIGGLLYAGLLLGLDARYASKNVETHVLAAQELAVSLKAELRDTRARIVSGQIFETRLRECTAADPSARRMFAERLAELEQEYQLVAARQYRIPDCATLQ